MDTMQREAVGVESLQGLKTNLESAIRGKSDVLEQLTVALLSGGHVLIEDVPGTGKTTMAKALALSLDATYSRVQFTPDLLPTDILGGMVYRASDGTFSFRPGPVFAHILLADEINRASPRTQSALLEAMAEHQVSIEGETRILPQPFMVLATQNPIEYNGTYPLPEAQLDRFSLQITLGYPKPADELRILNDQTRAHPLTHLKPVITLETLLEVQNQVRQVAVEESVLDYIVRLVSHTRSDGRLRLGVSPRGSLDLRRSAQARAYVHGRNHVRPDDVRALAVAVLSHRLVLDVKAHHSGVTSARIITDALDAEPVPG